MQVSEVFSNQNVQPKHWSVTQQVQHEQIVKSYLELQGRINQQQVYTIINHEIRIYSIQIEPKHTYSKTKQM